MELAMPPGVQYTGLPEVTQVPGCPRGLEYLTMVDQILVHEGVQLLEAFTSIECQNKFQVKNSAGQQIYMAGEESDFCARQCCGPHRGFVMHIADNFGVEVLRATREFKCCAGCPWCACIDCCAYEVVVESPPGVTIGYVKQTCSFIKPAFEIQDANNDPILTLSGPWCICDCPCCDVKFGVYTNEGEQVGTISKQWAGVVKELFTQADNFGVSFPLDLDVKAKATLVSAVFLINMMFFERKKQNND